MAKAGVSFLREDKLRTYQDALHHAGIETLPISPASPRSLDEVAGLVLTGGGDIAPSRYHAQPGPHTKNISVERDLLELDLLAEAERRGLPVLAICRGLQLLNVARGGTLHQDIGGHKNVDHAVTLTPASRIAAILGASPYTVNSRHHQAVDSLGSGLTVTARAHDGVVEALEDPSHPFLVAVQWHPEDRPATADARLFQAFAESLHG